MVLEPWATEGQQHSTAQRSCPSEDRLPEANCPLGSAQALLGAQGDDSLTRNALIRPGANTLFPKPTRDPAKGSGLPLKKEILWLALRQS